MNTLTDFISDNYKSSNIENITPKHINWDFIENNTIQLINSIDINNKSLLEKIIYLSIISYYKSEPLLSDSVYDKLLDKLKIIDKNNNLLSKIGFRQSEDKTKLPIFMGSMNKIKTKPELDNWIKKYKNYKNKQFKISEKLDGISILVVYKNNKLNLFTRGDGEYGRNISYLSNYNKDLINLNELLKNNVKFSKQNIIIRGELIITKHNFLNYKMNPVNNNYTTARGMVNGLISLKKHSNILSILDIVIYEVITPILKPDKQYDFIKNLCLKQAQNLDTHYEQIVQWDTLHNSYLYNTLGIFKKNSNYEIDGIIISHNEIYERINCNPKYSIAFKSNNEGKFTTVKEVIWEPSKYNILIPRIHFDMINLGSNIEYCSGFSAKFIKKNNIGPGTIIRIVLSGEVIPFVTEIIQSTKAQLPNINYIWNNTDTHIILKETTNEYRIKQILHFVKTIKIEHLSIGIIARLYEHGYDSLSKILSISKENLLICKGIKETLAEKLFVNINRIISKPIYLGNIMAGSLQFNSGIGIKKIEKIIDKYPDILEKNYTPDELSLIEGIQEKTASQFLDNLYNFKKFYKEIYFIKYYTIKSHKFENNITLNPHINNKFFVLTGFRDQELNDIIIKNNGTIQNTINKKTDYLIVKNKDSKTKKSEMAIKFNIPIIDLIEFYKHKIEIII